MQPIALIIFLITTRTTMAQNNILCDVISVEASQRCYIKETLAKISHCPNQMAVEKDTNTLYFSWDTGINTYIPAFLSIDTKKMGVLKGIKDAYSVATDADNYNVYFGGNNGIYRYNTKAKNLKRLLIPNLDIWWLFVRNGIYFVQFPSMKACRYINKTVEPVPELQSKTVHQFVLDGKDNVVFLNGSGVYGVKKDKNEVSLLKSGNQFVSIAVDGANKVHVCGNDGIFVINKKKKFIKLINTPGVTGIAFDKSNNIIYSDAQEINRLISVAKCMTRTSEGLNDV